MSKLTGKVALRPGDVDFDARRLRDLEVAEALGVEVKGGWYNRSSRTTDTCSSYSGCDGFEVQR